MEFDGHAVQVLSLVCPVDAEYLPAAQAVQVVALVCPVDAENLPASQAVHAAEPAIVLYVPAAQASHVEVPVYPALHWHAELPASEMKFGGHAVQVLSLVRPVDAEYLPATQSVHSSDPENGLYLPVAQAVHGELK